MSTEAPPSALLERTLILLRDRRETLFEIAVSTGLSYSWLARASSGKLGDARISLVQRLHDYLEEKARERTQAAGEPRSA